MLPFKLVYSEKYFLPIGEHIFRADKFRLIRELLLQEHVVDESDFIVPEPASEADVMLVHSPHYINKLMEGTLSAREELEMEIPYSPQVVDAFMLHTGGSILAAKRALKDGVCINVGGGFHHAFPEHGDRGAVTSRIVGPRPGTGRPAGNWGRNRGPWAAKEPQKPGLGAGFWSRVWEPGLGVVRRVGSGDGFGLGLVGSRSARPR